MGGDFEAVDFLLFSRCEEKPVHPKALISILDIDKSSDAETSAEEYESRFIGQKILGIVQNPLYMSSSGKTFNFSDVAVLTRSKNALKIYESVLTEMGVPVYSDVGEGFYGKKEILLALCILNSIDNPKRDIYLAGFMRSAPGGFTDDELCVIRQADKKDGLYAALNRYSQSGTDALLAEKCAAFIETLGEYRRLSRGKNAAELLWEIYTRMDHLNLCASPSFNADSAQQCADRRKNLLKLYEIARNYTKTSFRGVGAFIEYINGSMENTDEKADRLLGDDCVRLMTIHSSKGLEFPVCFVSDLARRFNRSDEREKTVFSDSAGIGLKLRDVEGLLSQTSSTGRTVIDTPFRKLVGGCEAEKGLSEEMRILYVALTRARDYLFMTAAVKNDVCKSFKRAYVNCATGGFSNAQSYMEAILNCVMSDECASAYRSRAELDALNGVCGDAFNGCLECELLLSDYLELDVLNTQAQAAGCPGSGQIDIQVYDTLKERGAFEYAGEVFTKIPSKLTVSQLKKGLIDEDGKALSEAKRDLKKIPDFCLGEKAPGGTERGTAMHLFMQFADYKRCENGGCAAEADRLFADGFIDGRTRALLDLPTLDGFFATELYGQVKNSKHVYRERRFNLEQDAGDYTDAAQRGIRNVLVQGVIDLYFENGDGTYTVVDFKTDSVGEQDGESVLKQRHSAQLLYYCRAVEEITGCRVSEAQLFSFALLRGVSVEV